VQELCRQNFTAPKVGRSTQGKTREESRMIVDDNFVGLVMFALVGVIYLAYKVGEYVGQMKSDK
jgi:hypothetical protein